MINAIRKESGDRDELLRLDDAGHLRMEKEVLSVANVCRGDICALLRLKAGGLRGALVLVP